MNIEQIKKALIEYAKENKNYVDKTYVQTMGNQTRKSIQNKGN